MKKLNLGFANIQIPVDNLKSLHNERRLYFADETHFQGPYVTIHSTCTDNHGKKRDFDIDVEGKIVKDDAGRRFFKVEKAGYLLENIPYSLRNFYKGHYAEIIKDNIDFIIHKIPKIK